MKRVVTFFLTLSLVAAFEVKSQETQPPKSYPIYYPMDTVNFETNTLPWSMVPNMNNCWLTGIPNTVFFNSAWSQPNAIVTNLGNPYPPGSWSAFWVKIPAFYYLWPGWPMMSTFISFQHKFDTDTLADWCSMEVSYDEGLTYLPLKDTILPWDTLPIGGFHPCDWAIPFSPTYPFCQVSGNSGGWRQCIYIWRWMIPVDQLSSSPIPDSIFVRFNFNSDGTSTGKEGWMVDDILVGWADLGGQISQPASADYHLSPVPADDYLEIVNSNSPIIRQVELFDLNGKRMRRQEVQAKEKLRINCGSFPGGIYFCKIKDNEGKYWHGKFIVSHR